MGEWLHEVAARAASQNEQYLELMWTLAASKSVISTWFSAAFPKSEFSRKPSLASKRPPLIRASSELIT